MRICKYCGRNFRSTVESCPGCGSNSFSDHPKRGEYAIPIPPEKGYNIRDTYYQITIVTSVILIVLSAFVVYYTLRHIVIGMFKDGFKAGIDFLFEEPMAALMIVVPLLLILYGIHQLKKSIHKIEQLKVLSTNGVLVKHLPYKVDMVGSNSYILTLEYETPQGEVITLKSEPKPDAFIHDADGKADLLIDPNDYDNFYIEVDIK